MLMLLHSYRVFGLKTHEPEAATEGVHDKEESTGSTTSVDEKVAPAAHAGGLSSH